EGQLSRRRVERDDPLAELPLAVVQRFAVIVVVDEFAPLRTVENVHVEHRPWIVAGRLHVSLHGNDRGSLREDWKPVARVLRIDGATAIEPFISEDVIPGAGGEIGR